MPFAKKMRMWFDNEVLPSLWRYGSYSMQPKEINFPKFYDSNAISNFYGKAVVYIGYLGFINHEHIFKYGLSRNMFKRDYQQHSKFFDRFDIVLILKTDNCEQIELLFENDIKVYNLHRVIKIKNRSCTELFTVTQKYNIDYLIKHITNLVDKYPLPAIKSANDKINELQSNLSIIESNNRIKELESQYKLSDNYQIELEIQKIQSENIKIQSENIKIQSEKEIRLKEIDSETQLQIQNMQFQMEHERNILKAMENGYDISYLTDNVIKNKNNYNNDSYESKKKKEKQRIITL
jgi:hypothetical protein